MNSFLKAKAAIFQIHAMLDHASNGLFFCLSFISKLGHFAMMAMFLQAENWITACFFPMYCSCCLFYERPSWKGNIFILRTLGR